MRDAPTPKNQIPPMENSLNNDALKDEPAAKLLAILLFLAGPAVLLMLYLI